MSIAQSSTEQHDSGTLRCPRCNSILPPRATFCGTCGERTDKVSTSSSIQEASVVERYRFTSLVRRHPYVQLFLAIDTQTQRPVAIRDIDISSLQKSASIQAIVALKQEYDLLRHQRVHDLMPLIDLRLHERHIFTIAGWPFTIKHAEQEKLKLQTLQDLLQSGVGLPDEQIALIWVYRICRALDRLHSNEINVGDLDPNTIVVSSDGYNGLAALMVSWLPPSLRTLLSLPAVPTHSTHFSAPETKKGKLWPSSDLYSLGAVLYLLLTGTVPDTSNEQTQRALRSPRELNPHVSAGANEIAMRALAFNSSDRYSSASEMAKDLLRVCSDKQLHSEDVQDEQQQSEEANDVTISIVPLQARLAEMYLARIQENRQEAQNEQNNQHDEHREEDVSAPSFVQPVQQPLPEPLSRPISRHEHTAEEIESSLQHSNQPPNSTLPAALPGLIQAKRDTPPSMLQRVKEQITGVLPRVSRESTSSAQQASTVKDTTPFFKRLQRFLLGEQQRSTTAAALIETPLRVQLNQGYTIRIHLTGRDEPVPPGARKGTPAAGLSALIQGDIVHIEVRSALYQNYAYIVQRADVTLPARGYAAEVTIPMQPLSSGPSGRRERLHIFFTDELRQPLYEKPFIVEVFVSHLVQSGREGYNVLTIPM